MNLGAIILRGLAIFLVAAIVIGGFVVHGGQLTFTDPIGFVMSVVEGAQSFTLDYLLWMIVGSLLLAMAWDSADRKT